MLQFLELQSLEDLLEKTVPHDILQPKASWTLIQQVKSRL